MKRVGTFPKKSVIENQYQVQKYLGEHDCCEVYRVVDLSSHELKLMKVIQNELLSKIDIALLKEKLHQASLLVHPNLMIQSELQNFISDEVKYYYFLNDYLTGESLENLTERKLKLTLTESLDILLPVLEVVDYLDHHKKLHKFIDPSYIYLDYNSEKKQSYLCLVKVNQFFSGSKKNIALAYQSSTNVIKKTDAEDDLFAWVVVLYKCITGVHPWNYDIDWEEQTTNIIKKRIALHRMSYQSTPLSFYERRYEKVDDIFSLILDDSQIKEKQCISDFKSDLLKAFDSSSKILGNKELKLGNNSKKTSEKNPLRKGLEKVAGMSDLKNQLDVDVIQPLKQIEKYQKYRVEPLNGILLYGPPGCGKTFIAQCLAEEIGYSYFEIKPSDLASTYIHGTQEKIAKLFKGAEEKKPSLIFIDEIDAVLPNRNEGDLNHHHLSEVNEFLAQMTNCGERGILVVGATNRPKALDTAMLRTGRLEKHIYIDFPDFNARLGMLKHYLENRPCSEDLDLFNLAILTVGYTSSDLKYIVNETAKLALTKDSKITDEFFKEVIGRYKPSVKNDDSFSQF
ncbi:AAA family ATPase [Acinetobacter indicus]|uniref:AAA family ATPase n=1 Tax=Acinetobacter indicus TaxID=756892 RepID=UPI0032B61D65